MPTITAETGRLLKLALVVLAAGFWVTIGALAPSALVVLVLAWALGVGLLLAVPFAVIGLIARAAAASERVTTRRARHRARPATR